MELPQKVYYRWNIDAGWHGDFIWQQTVVDPDSGEVVATIGDNVTTESIERAQLIGYKVVRL